MAEAARAVALLLVAIVTASEHSSPRADLIRARQRVPRNGWKGDSFAKMSSVLTSHLSRRGHRVRPCTEWSVAGLQHLQRRLFNDSNGELLVVYDAAADNRRQRFANLELLEAHWAQLDRAMEASEDLSTVRRDGLCHESVMWWVHHLTTPAQQRLTAEGVALPSLPQIRHGSPAPHATAAEQAVHGEYAKQVSCQQCHTGVDPAFQDATLPEPLPVDKVHPGRERSRSCDFQNQPKCGPCDGLGGQRWGDGPEDMVPMACEALHGPETAPTTRGRYPPLATARITGDTRTPVAVQPGGPAKYSKLTGTLSLGWTDGVMRMRYDFPGMGGSQVSVQTLEQAKRRDTGATLGIGSHCVCMASIAGNMHVRSFEASDPLDPLKLPPEEGGAAYLGRVRVTLDGETALSNRTVVADHFLKWAFHFLVNADEASPDFGLPLRLYAPYGVLMVYDSWKLGDPAADRPDIWKMPADCNVTAPACSVFARMSVGQQQLVV